MWRQQFKSRKYSQLLKCLFFDLPDPLPCLTKIVANTLQCFLAAAHNAKAPLNYLSLLWLKFRKCYFYRKTSLDSYC